MRPLILIAILLAACKRAGTPAAAGSADTTSTPVSGTPVAFRLPHGGGTVEVYRLPSLEPVKWTAGRVTAPRSAVGVDVVGRRLVYRDSADQVVAYDLVASRERVVAPRGALAALGTDGTLLAVDSTGGITESQPWGTRAWSGSLGHGVRAAFTAPDGRLLVVRHGGTDSLLMATRENGIEEGRPAPSNSGARSADRDGDAIAFAVDSGIVVEELDADRPWFVRLAGHPTALVFTPSGHRLYVALADKSELAVVDRFAEQELSAIELPGRAEALRMDPWGRALLVLSAGRSAPPTWVVSLAHGGVSGELRTTWGTDLPSVSQEGVVLTREGGGIVARDLRTLDSLGGIAGGDDDVWFAARGSPPPATAALRALVDTTPRRGTQARRPPPADSAAVARTAAATFWVQVSVSRNEAWARALADELNQGRHNARVAAPGDSTEGWRVLTGPYLSRDAADSAGRALGRPYWVVDRGPGPE